LTIYGEWILNFWLRIENRKRREEERENSRHGREVLEAGAQREVGNEVAMRWW